MQTHSILSISTHVQNCFYFLLFILVRVGVLLLLCLGNSRYFQFFCLLSSTCNFFSWVHCPDVKLASKKWRKSEKEKKICAKQTHHDIPSMFFGWEWGKSSSSDWVVMHTIDGGEMEHENEDTAVPLRDVMTWNSISCRAVVVIEKATVFLRMQDMLEL